MATNSINPDLDLTPCDTCLWRRSTTFDVLTEYTGVTDPAIFHVDRRITGCHDDDRRNTTGDDQRVICPAYLYRTGDEELLRHTPYDPARIGRDCAPVDLRTVEEQEAVRAEWEDESLKRWLRSIAR